jgi:hypothetical protein
VPELPQAPGPCFNLIGYCSKIIALFAERTFPKPRPIADADSEAPAEFMARRRQAIETIGIETNRYR